MISLPNKFVNWVSGIMNSYEIESNYEFSMHDEITGQKVSVCDLIASLSKKVQELDDKCKVLQEENINLTNELYRLENSLDARIDILTAEKFVYQNKSFTDS